jgi:hypothetical protein
MRGGKQMEVTKCDRCGEYVDKPSDMLPRVSYRKDCHSGAMVKAASLCPGCYESFHRWLDAFPKAKGESEDANND